MLSTFGIGSRPFIIGRIVTATITLICVLIVYDGWNNLRLLDVVLVIVGPIVAIFTSHVFASTLVQQVELERRPTFDEWLGIVGSETRCLLLAAPPIAILLVLRLAQVSIGHSIQAIIALEALSLTFWAGLAAYHAGLRGRSLFMAVLAGLAFSGLVLTLQVVLQPGKAGDELGTAQGIVGQRL